MTGEKKVKLRLGALVGPSGIAIGKRNLVGQGGGDEGEHKSNKGKH